MKIPKAKHLSLEKSEKNSKDTFHIKYSEAYKRIENWQNIFDVLTCKFYKCKSIFYGSPEIQSMINTKTKLFNPILKNIIDELLSYLKMNSRSISVNISQSEELKDIVNDIIGSIMIKGDVYNDLITAFKDYLIYGISIIKLNTNSDTLTNVENVDISNCVWDTNVSYKNFKPSFFIREYIINNFEASNKYGEQFVEIKKNKTVDFNRINKSTQNLLDDIQNTTLSNKRVKVSASEDIFSNAISIISKDKVNDGLSQVLEYYCLKNVNNPNKKGETYKVYQRYVFVNGQLANKRADIQMEEFPYIVMTNHRHDSTCVSNMFDSKVHDAMAEVIQFNIIENSKCDAILASANGATFINRAGLMNKNASLKRIRSNVVEVDSVIDGSISDMIMNVPPASVDQSMMLEANNIISRARQKFGLLNLDPNLPKVTSGEHEGIRLDRESQTISNIVSPLDHALSQLGQTIVKFIKKASTKEIKVLLKLTNNPKAEEILKEFYSLDDNSLNIDVSESNESPNNSMKKFRQLKTMAEIMDTRITVPPSVIAEAINASDEVKRMFEEYNAPSSVTLESVEIQEKEASAIDKLASAKKKIAETKNM